MHTRVSGMQTTFIVETHGVGMTEITSEVVDWAQGDGLLTLFVCHTSCSLLIGENADPDVQRDLLAFLRRLIPPADDPSMSYLTHMSEGPDDMPAHLKGALLPVSLSLPVKDSRPMLGTWQGIYLVEHRDRPRRREVAACLTRT